MIFAEKVRTWGERIKQSSPALAIKKIGVQTESHSFVVQTLMILILRACMDITYVVFLSPIYAYSGFTTSITPLYYLTSWVPVLVYAPFCVELINRKRSSDILMTGLHHLFFIPFSCYCGCYGANVFFFLIGVVYWGILLFFQFHIPFVTLKKLSSNHTTAIMTALTVLSCLTVMYISGRYAGFRFTLNFLDVYGTRAEAAGYDIPKILSYLLSMMPVILSILLVFWLQKKKYVTAALLCIVYLFLFSISAQKSTFFFLILLLACWFFYRSWMRKWISVLMVALTIISMLELFFTKTFYIMSVFIRRIFLLPVQICEQYLQFFLQNPQNLFRDGIMGKMGFNELYNTPIPRIIGEFRGHTEENANGGLLADLFSNMPLFPGIILMPLILIICFRLLDMTTVRLPERLRFPISFYFALMFISGVWSTILLSSGFLLACILLYIYPSEEETHGAILRN